jgi:hypothetical protein
VPVKRRAVKGGWFSCATMSVLMSARAPTGCACSTQKAKLSFPREVRATEEALEAVCSEIAALDVSGERVVGIDLRGGPAALLEAVLLERGERVRYIPGTALNKAREAYAGGE